MFLVSLSYKKPIEEVLKHLEEHNAFLNRLDAEKKLVFSARKNPRTGGIILLRNLLKNEAEQIITQDPFYRHQIADYEITEIIPRICAAPFDVFIEKES